MKIYFSTLLIATTLFLSSCEKKYSPVLSSTSPSEKVSLSLHAEMPMMFSPWNCTLGVKGYNAWSDSIFFEIVADEINDKNVKFYWKSNEQCTIAITEKNGEQRIFSLEATPTMVHLQEIQAP